MSICICLTKTSWHELRCIALQGRTSKQSPARIASCSRHALHSRGRFTSSGVSNVKPRTSNQGRPQVSAIASCGRQALSASRGFSSCVDRDEEEIPDLKLLQLRSDLDLQIVGHDDMKECMLLGLLAKEHIYIEGPPGVGKTQLAEATASEAGLASFFYQFHRDTRVHELIGDATILREQTPQGEVIRQGVHPGGLLTAQVCILDDISRAPGEALNVLLRLLNEREYAGAPIQLRCAIATGNPPREEFFNEPLDPAILDRFALQLSVCGHVKSADWTTCERIVRRHALKRRRVHGAATNSLADQWPVYDDLVTEVELPDEVLSLLLGVLESLVKEHGLGTAHPALLTDRTFLVKAPRLMQARALLNGRHTCIPEDLFVLKFLTRFRVPESIHQQIHDIIQAVIDRQHQPPPRSTDQMGAAEEESQTPARARTQHEAQLKSKRLEARDESSHLATSHMRHYLHSVWKYLNWFWTDLRGAQRPLVVDEQVHIEGVEAFVKTLHGSLQRSEADAWQRPGGMPRSWRLMRRIDEVDDADSVDLSIWCSNPSPTLPRTAQRKRIERGGALAVLRDISDSMSRPRQEHMLARCASLATLNIIDLARRHHMRVGYIEFGDDSWKYFTRDSGSSFFTRDYMGMQGLARNLKTRGSTFYQRALQDLLGEFERLVQMRGPGERMHAVVLSDGEPTIGCTELHKERRWAQKLRVCIHTIFIGKGAYPPVLARLAMDTGGKRFQAIPRYEAECLRMTDVTHEPLVEQSTWRKWVSA